MRAFGRPVSCCGCGAEREERGGGDVGNTRAPGVLIHFCSVCWTDHEARTAATREVFGGLMRPRPVSMAAAS